MIIYVVYLVRKGFLTLILPCSVLHCLTTIKLYIKQRIKIYK